MFKIFKTTVSILLLVCMAAAPLACVNINKKSDDQSKKEVTPAASIA